MLLTLYSSFKYFEEVIKLTLGDVEREEAGFVSHFRKGNSYQFGESNIGIASLHAKADHSSDWLFPSCRVSKVFEVSLDKPVSYSVIQKQFSFAVSECNFDIGLSKVGLHCLHMGGVMDAVRAGDDHDVLQKAMLVKQ